MFLFTSINNRWLQKLWPGTSYMSHVQLKPIHGSAMAVWLMQLHVRFSRHTGRIMQNSTVELLVQITLRHTLKMVNMSKTGPEGTLNDLCFCILNDVMTVSARNYHQVLQKLCTKNKHHGTLTDGIILLYNSAYLHVPWEVFKHSAYSPHLLSCEFHVFGLYQRALKRLFICFGWEYAEVCHTVAVAQGILCRWNLMTCASLGPLSQYLWKFFRLLQCFHPWASLNGFQLYIPQSNNFW